MAHHAICMIKEIIVKNHLVEYDMIFRIALNVIP